MEKFWKFPGRLMSALESFVSQLRQGIATVLGVSGIKILNEKSNAWNECFILGIKYNCNEEEGRARLSKIQAMTYFCYRVGFPPLNKSNGKELTSDIGWGCMHRSGQMLAASLILSVDATSTREKVSLSVKK